MDSVSTSKFGSGDVLMVVSSWDRARRHRYELHCYEDCVGVENPNKKCTSIFTMYFIHNVLTNMFRQAFRPTSGWCYYYKNTNVQIWL